MFKIFCKTFKLPQKYLGRPSSADIDAMLGGDVHLLNDSLLVHKDSAEYNIGLRAAYGHHEPSTPTQQLMVRMLRVRWPFHIEGITLCMHDDTVLSACAHRRLRTVHARGVHSGAQWCRRQCHSVGASM